jgi:mannose-6-phosphate isomerase-like protein (cupin superfamily)
MEIQMASQAEGIAVVDCAHNANHAVLLVRRTKPGEAEVHMALTDVWYVIDGTGMLVTGGNAVDAKTTAPGELRGSGISGGIPRRIGKGDIIDIPAGVPHWVSKIDGKELVYLTVKVTTPKR